MKRQIVVLFVLTGLTWSAGTQDIYAQGVANPLGVYGMDRFVSPDVRTKGMGWAGTAAAENAGALFTNPALLTTVKSIDFRFSGSFSGVSYDQRQEWYPDKPYATLSLLFEDRLDGIVDTNSLQPRPLERGYDDIGPNWEKSNSAARPGAFVAAVPLELGGLRLVAAAGYGEAMNLDHYFQNNNALSPNIGSFQPAPIPRPALGETVKVNWYQHFVERSGSVFGITPGIAVGVGDRLSLGLAATILTGSTDDAQGRVERGFLRLTTSPTGSFNVYTVDSVYYRVTASGSSSYSGVLPTLGVSYRTDNIALGFSYRLPGTITRKWDLTTDVDTTGGTSAFATAGEDKVDMPANVAVGLAFYPHKRWKIGVDYVINNYSDAVYTPASDTGRHPWVGAKYFRVGAELRVVEGLYLRGGYREDVLSYSAEGSPITADPIRGSAFTLGVGIRMPIAVLDLAYEYNRLKYHDAWTSNINYNTRTGNIFSAELSVSL